MTRSHLIAAAVGAVVGAAAVIAAGALLLRAADAEFYDPDPVGGGLRIVD